MLTQAQIDFYHTNGYLGVENVISAEEVAELQRVTDEFVEKSRQVPEHTDVFDLEPDHTSEAPRLRRVKDPVAQHPVYDRVSRHERIVDIVAQLVGPNVRYSSGKLNMKSAAFGSAVEWHQDWADFTAGILRGQSTQEARMVAAPLRLPLPGHRDGVIYELQRKLDKPILGKKAR